MKSPYQSGEIRVTSPYGWRGNEFHKGIDLVGQATKNIVAVEDATVGMSTIVTDRGNATWEWGNYIRLDLADGKRLYHCHLSQRLVSTGQRVAKGQIIGVEGATGNATGSHLHWELRPAGTTRDSLDIAAWSGIPNVRGVYTPDAPAPEPTPTAPFQVGDTVVLNAGAKYTNGVSVPQKYIGVPYTVQQVATGRVLIRELYSWVANGYVSHYTNAPTPPVSPGVITVGSRVKILPGAVYTNGKVVPNRYIGQVFTVQQVKTDRSLLQELFSWVKNQYLERV